jgi:D-amino-acid oxidase
VNILARRDGIVVQDGGIGDMEGYNDTNEQPDRAAAESAVRVVAELYGRMAGLGQASEHPVKTAQSYADA